MRKSWLLNRRAVLRGAGVAASLPLLDVMRPLLPGGEPARRMVFVYFPNGASTPNEHDPKWGQWRWLPHDPGKDYEFTNVLKCLGRGARR
jgi:hypothetical protein